jgi:hypothetical protein
MTQEMQLNKADLEKLMQAMNEYKCDVVKIIRHAETSIGYLMDIEFVDIITKSNRRVPVVTYSDW